MPVFGVLNNLFIVNDDLTTAILFFSLITSTPDPIYFSTHKRTSRWGTLKILAKGLVWLKASNQLWRYPSLAVSHWTSFCHIAHMWFDDTIFEADTTEEQQSAQYDKVCNNAVPFHSLPGTLVVDKLFLTEMWWTPWSKFFLHADVLISYPGKMKSGCAVRII